IVVVRERQQPLADGAAVAQAEIADAADPVGGPVLLDARLGDRGMPLGQAVEIADMGPDGVGRSVDDARRIDLDHQPLPSTLGGLPGVFRSPLAMLWPP